MGLVRRIAQSIRNQVNTYDQVTKKPDNLINDSEKVSTIPASTSSEVAARDILLRVPKRPQNPDLEPIKKFLRLTRKLEHLIEPKADRSKNRVKIEKKFHVGDLQILLVLVNKCVKELNESLKDAEFKINILHLFNCKNKMCLRCPLLDLVDDNASQKFIRLTSLEPKIDDFLNAGGKALIYTVHLKYYTNIYIAYNIVLREAGHQAAEFPIEEQPKLNFINSVKHACRCCILNGCISNRCKKLKFILAHWNQQNGLCSISKCRLCVKIKQELERKEESNSELIDVLTLLNEDFSVINETALISLLRNMMKIKFDKSKTVKKVNADWNSFVMTQFADACLKSLFNDGWCHDSNALKSVVFVFEEKTQLSRLMWCFNYLFVDIIFLAQSEIQKWCHHNLRLLIKEVYKFAAKFIDAIQNLVEEEFNIFYRMSEDEDTTINNLWERSRDLTSEFTDRIFVKTE